MISGNLGQSRAISGDLARGAVAQPVPLREGVDERAVCLGEVWLEGELLFTARVISGNLGQSRGLAGRAGSCSVEEARKS